MLEKTAQQTVLEVAATSVLHGLETGRALRVVVDDYIPELQQQRASFVTLLLDDKLRGCMGSIEAHRPLVEDVAENAFSAAFRDPRFPALTKQEYTNLHYHISLLTPPEPLSFSDEQDLLNKLRPGIDGLVLEDRGRRGTFLPSVWTHLSEPVVFLRHLKQKAGFDPSYWSDSLRIQRYTVEDIE